MGQIQAQALELLPDPFVMHGGRRHHAVFEFRI
jgi:hypothetical protein